MPLPIFTIQTFNQTTLQPAGAVFAHRVESVSIARNFFAGVTSSEGGRNTAIEKKMQDLTRVLMEELQLQSRTAYPNAVALVDVKMHFSDIGKDDSNIFLAGQASATALIKRNKLPTPVPTNAPVVPLEPVASNAPLVPLAPVASNAPLAPVASNAPLVPLAPVGLRNNSRMTNRPVNYVSSTNSTKVGGKKSFISKSRKNRI